MTNTPKFDISKLNLQVIDASMNMFPDIFVNATGNGWWTARNAYRIRVDLYTYATGNGVNQGGTAAVRCVHDTWKD